jgi:hypothetical protein
MALHAHISHLVDEQQARWWSQFTDMVSPHHHHHHHQLRVPLKKSLGKIWYRIRN